jgi:hypothetical protein
MVNAGDSQKAVKKTGNQNLNPMIVKNQVSAALTDQDIADIDQAMAILMAKFTFLISLTTEQRMSGMKIGEKSVNFVEKTLEYSKSNPELVPAYLDLTEFGGDFKLSRELLYTLRKLKPFVQNLEDTATETGIEALSAAMVFYNSVKTAAKQGVLSAIPIYEDLQKRFPGASGQAVPPLATT